MPYIITCSQKSVMPAAWRSLSEMQKKVIRRHRDNGGTIALMPSAPIIVLLKSRLCVYVCVCVCVCVCLCMYVRLCIV